MVVRRNEDRAGAFDHSFDDGFALFGCAAAENHFCTVAFRRGDFGGRRDRGHHDVGVDPARAGCEREGLRVVSWSGEGRASAGIRRERERRGRRVG